MTARSSPHNKKRGPRWTGLNSWVSRLGAESLQEDSEQGPEAEMTWLKESKIPSASVFSFGTTQGDEEVFSFDQ